jgi:hypothetical protein
MKFVARRLRPVEEDQLAAARWYDDQQPGLGDGFLDESDSFIAALAAKALHYSIRFADVRCARLRRFKRYGVNYLIHGREVIVLGIHHGARDLRWIRERRKQIG